MYHRMWMVASASKPVSIPTCLSGLLYQLMKELFPAEWLPISITVIFFLGGSNFTPTDSAMEMSPEEDN